MARFWLGRPKRTFDKTYVARGPLHVIIEPTVSCNLSCVMCRPRAFTARTKFFSPARSEWLPADEDRYMSDEVFRSSLQVSKNAVDTYVIGLGEPLLHPRLIDFVREIKRHKTICNLMTNGVLLTQEMSEALIEAGVDNVAISIDGATEETFGKIRGADLNVVTGNIEALQQTKSRKKAKNPTLAMAFVAMRENIEELPNLVDLAARLRIGKIEVNHMDVLQFESMAKNVKGEPGVIDEASMAIVKEWGLTGVRGYSDLIEYESLFHHKELANRYFDLALEKARRLGVELSVPYFQKNAKPFCTDIFDTIFITRNGKVLSCCFERFFTGDLRSESVEDVWNGEVMRGLRSRYHSVGIAELCPGCVRISEEITVRTS